LSYRLHHLGQFAPEALLRQTSREMTWPDRTIRLRGEFDPAMNTSALSGVGISQPRPSSQTDFGVAVGGASTGSTRQAGGITSMNTPPLNTMPTTSASAGTAGRRAVYRMGTDLG
jgi:hypothetical protein